MPTILATAVEVRVRLKKDVDLLRVYGSRRLNQSEAARVRAQEVAADAQASKRDGIKQDRQDDGEGGMRFFIPAFSRGDSHALLLKVGAKAGAGSLGIGVPNVTVTFAPCRSLTVSVTSTGPPTPA